VSPAFGAAAAAAAPAAAAGSGEGRHQEATAFSRLQQQQQLMPHQLLLCSNRVLADTSNMITQRQNVTKAM
jgi:hypothetical protein